MLLSCLQTQTLPVYELVDSSHYCTFKEKSESGGKKTQETIQSFVKSHASKSARVYMAVLGIYDFLGNLQSTDQQSLRIASCCHHGIKAKQCGSHTS